MASSKKKSDEKNISLVEQAVQLVAVLVVAVLVAGGTLKVSSWIHEMYLPFCDSTTSGSRENCVPCPEHGTCSGGKLYCMTGFRRQGRKCVEDSLIEKRASQLAHRFKDHVCRVNGESLCAGGGPVWLTDGEIVDDVKLDTKLQGPNLWLVHEKAVAIAANLLDSKFNNERLFCCPGSLVHRYKPIGCQLRLWFYDNFFKLLFMLPAVFMLASFLWKHWRKKAIVHRAEELYLQVCEALETKATEEPKEPWIVASRLRDHLLRRSERKNQTLWLQVERFVQEDSRIEQYPKVVKGESRIVWEWQVEGSLSPALLSKTRTRLSSASPLRAGTRPATSSHEEKKNLAGTYN